MADQAAEVDESRQVAQRMARVFELSDKLEHGLRALQEHYPVMYERLRATASLLLERQFIYTAHADELPACRDIVKHEEYYRSIFYLAGRSLILGDGYCGILPDSDVVTRPTKMRSIETGAARLLFAALENGDRHLDVERLYEDWPERYGRQPTLEEFRQALEELTRHGICRLDRQGSLVTPLAGLRHIATPVFLAACGAADKKRQKAVAADMAVADRDDATAMHEEEA